MTQEEKQLLLQVLSAMLPYGVVCVGITYDLDDDGERYIPVKVKNTLTEIHNYNLETVYVRLGLLSSCRLETVKPYLRPMSSMTEEEKEELRILKWTKLEYCTVDWLNERHFDYRGLIEKGLAIEAPEGMYNIKEKE